MLGVKSGEAAGAVAWHPEFRDPATLPDVRVVRSGTLATILSFTLAALALLAVAYQEYEMFGQQQRVSEMREKIARDRPLVDKQLALSRRLEEAARKVQEIRAFGAARVLPTELVLAIARARPDGVLVVNVFHNGDIVSVRGRVAGPVTEAALVADGFLGALRKDPFLIASLGRMDLSSVTPQPGGGGIDFEVTLRPEAAQK